MAGRKTFVGFGFGAIQTGLFLWEAQQSGNFDRLVVAVPNEEVVAALRRSRGHFLINVATRIAREVREIRGVEIFNSRDARDRGALLEAIADASEMATALPGVDTYEQPDSGVAELLAEGLRVKLRHPQLPRSILYAAENHNHAAELLSASLSKRLEPMEDRMLRTVFQPLNTVIGKMSRVVREPAEISEAQLQPFVHGGARAYLVEEFNRILISQVTLPEFQRGITVFEEKRDLLPFEEAKLYGHNAAHALLGYLGHQRGFRFIGEAAADDPLMSFVRDAFLDESGRALIARRSGVDPLFTPDGYGAFVDDLLERMVNPWLRDDIGRVTRDPRRKLGWDDRIVGTMRLALDAGIQPKRMAVGAAAALEQLHGEEPTETKAGLLDAIWKDASASSDEKRKLCSLVLNAGE